MLNFLKNWTLPIAMLAGALGYFVFANFTFLEPTKPFVNTFIAYITPFLIFAQLLLTFCKVDWRELMPSPWHGWLLLFQVVSASALAALLIFIPMDGSYREVFEAAMVCLICPTATAAAVIKLIHCRRSCPYQTHIPLQYIPKLWKFINTCLPDKLSNLGNSRIVFHLKHQSVHLILCHKLFLALFRILIHRTDLIDFEDPSILPNSLL